MVNLSALLAVAAFATVLLAVFGFVYVGAARSQRRGELDASALRVLRWALAGHLVLDALLAVTAFLT